MKLLILFVLFFSGSSPVIPAELSKIQVKLSEQEIAFNFLDLSDGEALLIQTGTGEVGLINTGSSFSQEELLKRLEIYHINQIDFIILTDSSELYAGNIEEIAEKYKPKIIYAAKEVQKQLATVYSLTVPFSLLEAGKKYELNPGLFIRVLYTPDKGAMTFSFSYGEHQILYMGQTDAIIEQQLMKQYPLQSSILKVGHFGDENGTSQELLEKVDPHAAIIFKQKKEWASDQVMERLQEGWIDIYQPYKLGTIMIKCDPKFYKVITVPIDERDFSSV
jgi:competence protein ComEC